MYLVGEEFENFYVRQQNILILDYYLEHLTTTSLFNGFYELKKDFLLN